MKVAISFTAGKDSFYGLDYAIRNGFHVKYLFSDFSSYSFHPSSYRYSKNNFKLLTSIAKCLDIPLIYDTYEGTSQAKKERCIERLFDKISRKGVDGVVIPLTIREDLKESRMRLCEKHKLEFIDPIWGKSLDEYIPYMIKKGYIIKFAAIFSRFINKKWVGKKITQKKITSLMSLGRKYNLDPGGEFKEYETIVVGGPLFKRQLKIISEPVYDLKRNLSYLKIFECFVE
jgi:uncharacterized protein (TIGR00290 family)